ncbi:MAG: hypothetical protein WC525_01270 [Candidatus Thermoplasmatota archaeon]
MEKTIVQFILENIFLFLPIGMTGVVATIILLFLPKQQTTQKFKDVEPEYVTVLKMRCNIYTLVYLFIWIAIIIIGLASSFFVPTLVGAVIAAIPLVVSILLEQRTSKSKGS